MTARVPCRYVYTFAQAADACVANGCAGLIQKSQLEGHSKCATGWLLDGAAPVRGYWTGTGCSTGCGGPECGWTTWSAATSPLAGAYCSDCDPAFVCPHAVSPPAPPAAPPVASPSASPTASPAASLLSIDFYVGGSDEVAVNSTSDGDIFIEGVQNAVVGCVVIAGDCIAYSIA